MFAVALAVAFTGSVAAATDASARSSCGDDGCVDVVAVDGIIDGIVASFLIDSIHRAETAGDVVAVVLQMDSPGTAIGHQKLNELAGVIADSSVPVSVWIGASGAKALGGAGELALVAESTGIAHGAYIGEIGEPRVGLIDSNGAASQLAKRTMAGKRAVDAGVIDRFAPTLVDHIGGLDQVDSKVVTVDGKKQRQPVQRVRLSKLPLPVQIMHTAASPSVAYLLVIIGLGLLAFEFFTAGVGVAGVVGGGFLLLGGFGVAELSFRTWALALLVGSYLAFGIDMQTGLARLWTWIGMIGFAVSSLFLFDEFGPSWLALIVGIGGTAAFVFPGMPSMNRARFGTPYVGREWLVGESGVVTAPLQPQGLVCVRDAEWVATGVDGFDAQIGSTVQIVDTDRMLLVVGPVQADRAMEPSSPHHLSDEPYSDSK